MWGTGGAVGSTGGVDHVLIRVFNLRPGVADVDVAGDGNHGKVELCAGGLMVEADPCHDRFGGCEVVR